MIFPINSFPFVLSLKNNETHNGFLFIILVIEKDFFYFSGSILIVIELIHYEFSLSIRLLL
jgi:hypothetical protein